jgi:hypothetical protein
MWMMRTELERFLALAAGAFLAGGLAAGCSVSSDDDGGGGGTSWLTGSGGGSTGGKTTTAGAGGVAVGGTAGAVTAGGTATGGTATGGTATGGTTSACLGDTTVAVSPPGCNDLPYADVYCTDAPDTMPEGYSVCLDYETWGVTRAGVMEDLVDCLSYLPDDAEGACTLQHDATWACVSSVEALACTAADSVSFCEDVVATCSEISTASCIRAFNTLTPGAGTAAANCMVAYGDPGCGQTAWNSCFPTPI